MRQMAGDFRDAEGYARAAAVYRHKEACALTRGIGTPEETRRRAPAILDMLRDSRDWRIVASQMRAALVRSEAS